jgi:hypothetical protein
MILLIDYLKGKKFFGEYQNISQIGDLIENNLQVVQKGDHFILEQKRRKYISAGVPCAKINKESLYFNKLAVDQIFGHNEMRFDINLRLKKLEILPSKQGKHKLVKMGNYYHCLNTGLVSYIRSNTDNTFFNLDGKSLIL